MNTLTKENVISLIDEITFENARRKLSKDSECIVKNFWNFNFPPDKFSEVLYVIYYNITPPMCCNGNKVSFNSYSKGYNMFCNKVCSCKNEYRREKIKNTWNNKSRQEITSIMEGREKTNIEKYGVKNPLTDIKRKVEFSLDTIEKRKTTCIEKYGVDNPNKSEIFRNKAKSTCIEKYGVDNPNKSEIFRNKIKETNRERYFNANTFHNPLPDDVLDIIGNKEKLLSFIEGKTVAESIKELDINSSYFYKILAKFDIKNRFRSYGEKEINDYVTSLGFETVSNSRKIISPYEIDVFVPSRNIAIEFNGLLWHSEFFGKKDRNYHRNKMLMARDKGVRLIHIYEDEWNNKNEIVKSVLSNILTVTPNRLYARKLSVKEIPYSESSDFLEENHLQGTTKSTSVSYGLYDKTLVSVMTFGKTGKTWEIKRFANKLNTNIVGGANKLFSSFMNDVNPSSIFSYCDLRYFTGDVYSNMGFKYEKDTKPGFDYVKNDERFNRKTFMKKNLETDKKAFDFMLENGYDRIWNCGNGKWVKNEEN